MLSAFSPKPVVELKQRDKSKIESVLAYGDRVFVGLNTGSLRIYRVADTHESDVDTERNGDQDGQAEGSHLTSPLMELQREVEKFSRRPIQQLAIIKEAGMLVSLSDGYVSFHDLESYNLSERLDQTRGATFFATIRNIVKDSDTGIHSIVSRLAVVVKRKVLIWTWQDMEPSQDAEELTLPSPIKSLVWVSGLKIIVGMDPGFSVVDLKSREVSDIHRLTGGGGDTSGTGSTRFGAVNASGISYVGMGSWVPKPLATVISEDEILLAKDVNSLFVDANGNPSEKRQVPWALSPEAVGFSYPYLLVLQPPAKGMLELRNPETLTLLQTIALPNAIILHVPQPNISLAHAGKGFLVASDRKIWRMDAVDYGTQLDELVKGSHFDEALSLITLIEDTLLLDKAERIKNMKILKAYSLFDQRAYFDSLQLFADAGAPPEKVISLFPESIAGNLFIPKRHSVEGGRPQSNGDKAKQSSPGKASGWGSLRGKPKKRGNSKNVDEDSVSIRSEVSAAGEDSRRSFEQSVSSPRRLEGKDLVAAVRELQSFLAHTRVQLQKYINFDGSLKISKQAMAQYSETQDDEPPFAHFIVRGKHAENVTWETRLHEVAVLVDTTLFRAYMLVSPSMAGSLFKIDNFCMAEVVEEKLYDTGRYSELIDFLHGKKLHEEALKLLERFAKEDSVDTQLSVFQGPGRTIKYLQQLPFEMIDLITKYAEWPIQAHPDAALEIFTADTANAESLPRDSVVEFLRHRDSRLTRKYLEHVIWEWKDTTPDLHDMLVELYLQQLKDTGEGLESNASEWQQSLEYILKTSDEYNKTQILKLIPTDDGKFFESRATVLGKLARHKEALQIYVYQMRDYRKAEEYCNQKYAALTALNASVLDPDDSNQPESIYTILLSLYLTPPSPNSPNLDAALNLLSIHGSRLPALSTIATLPTSVPIKDLESYFRARMRAANSISREEAITASLTRVEQTAWATDLLLGKDWEPGHPRTDVESGRSRRIIIGENRLCSVCHKRFGRATARVWPDGDVVHYGCSDRKLQRDKEYRA